MAGVSDNLTKDQEESLYREILEQAKSFDAPKILKQLGTEFELLSEKDLSSVDAELAEQYKKLVSDACIGATKMYIVARDNEEFEGLVTQFKSNDKLMEQIRALCDKDTKSCDLEKPSMLKKIMTRIIEMCSNLIKDGLCCGKEAAIGAGLGAIVGAIDYTIGMGISIPIAKGAIVKMIAALAKLGVTYSGATLGTGLGVAVVSAGICAIVGAVIGVGLGIFYLRKSRDLTSDITKRCTHLQNIQDMLSMRLKVSETYYRENKDKHTLLRSCEEIKKIYDRSKLKNPDRFEQIVSDRIESNYDVYEIEKKFCISFDIYKKLVETVLPPRNIN